MNYTLDTSAFFPVLSLSGTITSENEGAQLLHFVEEEMIPVSTKFIVDLEKVSFLNSAGLNALIALLVKARKSHGEVTIINLNEHIKKLLLITKLNTVFSVSENIDTAINYLRNN